jgi:hypothetical protein
MSQSRKVYIGWVALDYEPIINRKWMAKTFWGDKIKKVKIIVQELPPSGRKLTDRKVRKG